VVKVIVHCFKYSTCGIANGPSLSSLKVVIHRVGFIPRGSHRQWRGHPCDQPHGHAPHRAGSYRWRPGRPWKRCLSVSNKLVSIVRGQEINVKMKRRTCFWGSMLAKPPEWLDWPPLRAMSSTSSRGRLAKFPGLLDAILCRLEVVEVIRVVEMFDRCLVVLMV
jgi:hypothetical protein